MSVNEVMDIVTTRNGNSEGRVPIVDQSAIYRPNMALRGLQGFAASMKLGGGKKIGDQRIKTLTERPFLMLVEVTALASAGATSLTVNNSDFVRRYGRLAHKATQDITCSSDPTSSTTIPVSALAADVPAGTILLYHGATVPEAWTRPKAISRATDYHYDTTSVKQLPVGITWHAKYRETYVEGEVARITRQSKDEMDRILGYELILAKGVDATSSGTFSTQGLLWQGFDYNYVYCSGGVLTADMIDDQVNVLKLEGNAAGDVDLISCQKLISSASRAAQAAGIVRQPSPQSPILGVSGITRGMSTIDGISGFKMHVDQTLNPAPWNRIVLLVNWDVIDGIKYGDDYMQGSLEDAARNVADPGSGTFQQQITRSVGFRYRIPTGAVTCFDNVGSIRW